MAAFPALLGANGSHSTGSEAGGASADEFGEMTAELEFGLTGVYGQGVLEELVCLSQVLERIPVNIKAQTMKLSTQCTFSRANSLFNCGKKGRVKCVRLLQLAHVLIFEYFYALVGVHIEQNQSEEFPEI